MTRGVVSRFVPQLLLYVRSQGAAGETICDALLDRFSLPQRTETKEVVTVPLDVMRELGDAAAVALGDPLLGVHVALSRAQSFGLLEFMVACTPTLGGALDCLVRFHELVTDGLAFEAESDAGRLVLRCSIPNEPLCMGRHGNEYVVATVLRFLRDLSAQPVAVDSAFFAHPAPPRVDGLARFLGTRELSFGKGASGIVVDQSVTRLPVVTSNPPLLTALLEQAESFPRDKRAMVDLSARVRTRIRALLDTDPSVERVAAELKMSPRTLQRRLTSLGTSYTRLLDDERRTRAFVDIDESTVRMQEIALRVGYRDARAFLRAFRRWTGQSPTEYRVARKVHLSGAHGPGKISKPK